MNEKKLSTQLIIFEGHRATSRVLDFAAALYLARKRFARGRILCPLLSWPPARTASLAIPPYDPAEVVPELGAALAAPVRSLEMALPKARIAAATSCSST